MRAVGAFLLTSVFGAAAHAQCTVSGSADELVYNNGSGGRLGSGATVTSAGALTLPSTGTGLTHC